MEIEANESPRAIRDRAARQAKERVGADEVFFVNYAGVDGVNHYTGFTGDLSDEARRIFAGLEGRPTLVDALWQPSVVPRGERNRFQDVSGKLLEIERNDASIFREMYGPLEVTRSCRTRLYDDERFLGYVGCLRRGSDTEDFDPQALDTLNRFAEQLKSDILNAERLEVELPSPAYGIFDGQRRRLEWASPDVRPWFTDRRRERVRHALAADPLPAFIVVDGWVLRFSELGSETSERVMVSLEGAQRPQLAPALRADSDADFPGDFAPLAALGAVLDQLPTAAALVTEGLGLVCANRRAQKLLARDDGLRIRREMIVPERAVDAVALRDAVGRAVAGGRAVDEDDPADEAAKLVSISRSRPLPLDVLAVPFPCEGAESVADPPRVLLLIYDPAARLRIDDDLVERLFRLTMTEAFVAARLAEGKSIADIARMRRCSESTVRTHVKRILQKTGAARQADLVRLILTSPTIRPK